MREEAERLDRKRCLQKVCRVSANTDGRFLTIIVCLRIFQVFTTLTWHLKMKAWRLKTNSGVLRLVTGNWHLRSRAHKVSRNLGATSKILGAREVTCSQLHTGEQQDLGATAQNCSPRRHGIRDLCMPFPAEEYHQWNPPLPPADIKCRY
jgi:hypothetical protein